MNVPGADELKVSVDGQRQDIDKALKSKWYQLHPSGTGKSRISITYKPQNPSNPELVKLWIEAFRVDPEVEGCMGAKACLSKLGDGTEGEFELRNLNADQKTCLKNQVSQLPQRARGPCNRWRQCLAQSGKLPQLLAMLKAGSSSAIP